MNRLSFLNTFYVLSIVLSAIADASLLVYILSNGYYLAPWIVVASVLGLGVSVALQVCFIFFIKVVWEHQKNIVARDVNIQQLETRLQKLESLQNNQDENLK